MADIDLPLDVGRVSHLDAQMHRSEDNDGNPIPDGYAKLADGAKGFRYVDSTTFGSADAILRYGGAAEWFKNHPTAGSTETIDLDDGNVHLLDLSANCTLTFSGAVSSIDGQAVACGFALFVEQDSTPRTITWPGSVVWPGGVTPTLSTTSGAIDIFTFATLDGGTTWYGFPTGGGSTVGTLDDLSDVTITAAAADDTLRYDGADWINDNRRWEPVTFDPGTGPEIVFDSTDVVMTWKAY